MFARKKLEMLVESVRGFFGRSRNTIGALTPPDRLLTPEQRLNSVRDGALRNVVRGIPLSGEEEDALIFGEHLL